MIDRRRLLQALLALGVPAPLFAQERANIVEAARTEGSVALATSVSAAGFL